MKFKDFYSDFTTRWSTTLIALYGLIAFIAGFYYPLLYIIQNGLENIHISIFELLFSSHCLIIYSITGVITAITVVLLGVYCLFTKIKNKLFGKIFFVIFSIILLLAPVPFISEILK